VSKNKEKSTGSLLRVLPMVRPFVPLMLLCAFFIVVINCADLVKPYIIEVIMDDFLVAGNAQHGVYSIKGMSFLYLGVVLLSSVLTVVQVNIMNWVGQEIIRTLRDRVFSHVQHMPLRLLDKFSSGRLVTRGTNDIEAMSEYFTDILLSLFKDVFLVLGIMVMMLIIEWKLALVSFVTVPLIYLFVRFTRHFLRPMHRRIKELTGRINGFFAENISGMAIVQAFHSESAMMKLFRRLNIRYYKESITRVLMNGFTRPVVEVINTLAIAVLLWYGMGQIMNFGLGIGVLYAFTTYIKQFFQPITDFMEKYDSIQSAGTSADRIFELLDYKDELEDLEAGAVPEKVTGRIEFKNVWFAYEGENWVLKDVSFTVEPGQLVALVGHTGSGKTTIISLISRFYEIQKGEILLDGVDIRTISLHALRRHIAVVLQDPFLFSGNIRNNIALGEALTDEEVTRALEVACASEFIAESPDGIYRQVRERGATFSAGQRQRLSFARAVASDPSILVLDEATAHIDSNTEQLLQRSLEQVSVGRTLVVIAHRLSTIENADKIIVLSHGKIIEQGTHKQLLEAQGHYRTLYNAQFAE